MPADFNKAQLHDLILNALQGLVDNAQAAVDRAYEAATHEENIAENKYDTLGLEASYLTQGQSRRLAQCESDLAAFKALTPRPFSANDPITIGALVQVIDDKNREQAFFLGPSAGGVKVRFQECDVVMITPEAPLGKALLNGAVWDEIAVPISGRVARYEITHIN